MQNDDLLQRLKDNLNGRPGQPIVLGVCLALARRTDVEPWVFRAAAIVLGIFFTLGTLLAYVLLGLLLEETAERTRGAFRGLFLTLRDAVDKLVEAGRNAFQPPR
ncbi:MAG: PspC domain-containing protein [Gammaproteobacteria bacterium]